MDFFDPQKQKIHSIRLGIGYAVIGLLLLLTTTVLLHMAYGYGLNKDGQVIQNGLVFVSTQPNGADVYLDGQKYKDKTNTRLNIPAGQYVLQLKKDGYYDWKRALTVEGGKIERFDYAFLFPKELKTAVTKQYEAAPVFSTQSLDRRWLLVWGSEQNTFDQYDLNASDPRPQLLTVSSDILAAGSTTTGWKTIEWAKDNRHVVLQRSYDRQGQTGTEYILFDREQPDQSQNLTVALGFNPAAIELRNQNYDQYYLFDQSNSQLFTASLREPTPRPYVGGVLAFTSENDIVAYVTAQDADAGKVAIRIKQGDDASVAVRQMPANTTYVLDMAQYNGSLYLAVGATSENRVFVFHDPLGALHRAPDDPLVPVQILKVVSPNYVTFSANKRFVITENSDRFSVYDIETDRGYAYQVAAVPDVPQTHAEWMDGFRLTFVSGGKLVVFDYDGTNLRTLSAANPNHLPAFDNDYRYLYTIDQSALTSTPLLTPADL